MKFRKGNEVIEEKNPNNYSVYLRDGWEEVNETLSEDEVKEQLRSKLSDAGVEFDGRWGLERLEEEVNKL